MVENRVQRAWRIEQSAGGRALCSVHSGFQYSYASRAVGRGVTSLIEKETNEH
jgi:hypothetical protein